MRMCQVWGEVRYLHPWVVEGKVDWDQALMAALPAALAAKTDEEEAAAMRTMLAALHDPATRVDQETTPAPSSAPNTRPSARTQDGVVIVPVVASGWGDIYPELGRVLNDLAGAKLAILDLRAPTPDRGEFARLVIDQIAGHLPPKDAAGLGQRVVEHRGYRPQAGLASGEYKTMLAEELSPIYPASRWPHPARMVFLANTASGVPDVAWAMQSSGDAAIVMEGPLGEDAFADPDVITLSPSYRVTVRRAEPTGLLPRPDVELDAGTPEAKVVEAAVRSALHPSATANAGRIAAAAPAPPAWRPDAIYANEAYPSRDRRVLALFRFWSVIHYFYPYLSLMGDGWDEAFAEFLPRFEGAANERDYVLAAAELAARIHDGHVSLWGSSEVREFEGSGRMPFTVRMVEGQPVVTSLVVGTCGAAVGDVVVAVDGEPVLERMARHAKYVPASTPAWRSYWSAGLALEGPENSVVRLTLRGASGVTRELNVTRGRYRAGKERTGDAPWRLIDESIGYADLDRLQVSDVDAMFAGFQKTRAIVFDMRGYPNATVLALASRLNVRHARVATQFFEPLVTVGSSNYSYFDQSIPPAEKPLYRGKTVMLVDERTISQAEHTGLFFEAANGTTFIGSQTAGADGDITNLSLPGGLFVSFSGHDVRHADGRQLQGIGLVPAIEVRPTIAGIRAGRDEVLERALAYLRSGK